MNEPLAVDIVGEHGCWLPNRQPNGQGYVDVMVDGRLQGLHRLTYESLVGPIPDGYELHHAVCENRWCANPWHCTPLSRQDHRKAHRKYAEVFRIPYIGGVYDGRWDGLPNSKRKY